MPDDAGAGRLGKPLEFIERFAMELMFGKENTYKDRRLAGDTLLRGSFLSRVRVSSGGSLLCYPRLHYSWPPRNANAQTNGPVACGPLSEQKPRSTGSRYPSWGPEHVAPFA